MNESDPFLYIFECEVYKLSFKEKYAMNFIQVKFRKFMVMYEKYALV